MTKLVTDTGLQKALELVADKINNPLPVSIEYPNNTAQVDVDVAGTKHDMIESPESTIELNGKTLVNLWGSKKSDFTYSSNTISYVDGFTEVNVASKIWLDFFSKKVEMFKPSTEYTVICNVKENTLTDSFWVNTQDEAKSGVFASFEGKVEAGTTGIFIYKVNTLSDISNCKVGLRSTMRPSEIGTRLKFQCIILEGDYTNVPVEYFEGLKSSGETNGVIEVKSTGKNLFNGVWEFGDIGNNGKEVNSSTAIRNVNYIAIQPFITYMVSRTNGSRYNKYRFYDKDYNCLGGTMEVAVEGDRLSDNKTNGTLKVLDNRVKYMRIVDITADITNVYQIEKGTKVTEYEPYKENIITLPEIEPLRSLPNGICDEAFIHDDKLIVTRKCAEIVLNGTETWTYNTSANYFGIQPKHIEISNYKPLSVRGLADSIRVASIDKNDLAIQNGATSYVFIIKNTNYQTLEDFISWLQNNVITYVYELEAPTYEWYELPSPHLYKDGNIFVETGVIPLTSNSHDINVSLRSAINTNVEEIIEIKEELNTLDAEIATGEELLDLWQGIYEGVNE